MRSMVFRRATARGSTPPGKKTELRKGRMGNTAGMSSWWMVPGGTTGAAFAAGVFFSWTINRDPGGGVSRPVGLRAAD
jgi:hypothetical protein